MPGNGGYRHVNEIQQSAQDITQVEARVRNQSHGIGNQAETADGKSVIIIMMLAGMIVSDDIRSKNQREMNLFSGILRGEALISSPAIHISIAGEDMTFHTISSVP